MVSFVLRLGFLVLRSNCSRFFSVRVGVVRRRRRGELAVELVQSVLIGGNAAANAAMLAVMLPFRWLVDRAGE